MCRRRRRRRRKCGGDSLSRCDILLHSEWDGWLGWFKCRDRESCVRGLQQPLGSVRAHFISQRCRFLTEALWWITPSERSWAGIFLADRSGFRCSDNSGYCGRLMKCSFKKKLLWIINHTSWNLHVKRVLCKVCAKVRTVNEQYLRPVLNTSSSTDLVGGMFQTDSDDM